MKKKNFLSLCGTLCALLQNNQKIAELFGKLLSNTGLPVFLCFQCAFVWVFTKEAFFFQFVTDRHAERNTS